MDRKKWYIFLLRDEAGEIILAEIIYFSDNNSKKDKGQFFSDHSALINRPDAKTQLSLLFEDLGF